MVAIAFTPGDGLQLGEAVTVELTGPPGFRISPNSGIPEGGEEFYLTGGDFDLSALGDDFDDSSIDAGKWTTETSGDAVVSESGTFLIITASTASAVGSLVSTIAKDRLRFSALPVSVSLNPGDRAGIALRGIDNPDSIVFLGFERPTTNPAIDLVFEVKLRGDIVFTSRERAAVEPDQLLPNRRLAIVRCMDRVAGVYGDTIVGDYGFWEPGQDATPILESQKSGTAGGTLISYEDFTFDPLVLFGGDPAIVSRVLGPDVVFGRTPPAPREGAVDVVVTRPQSAPVSFTYTMSDRLEISRPAVGYVLSATNDSALRTEES